jgi:hypothetical protein
MNYEEDFLRLPPGVGKLDRELEARNRLKRIKAKRWMDEVGIERLLGKKIGKRP